MYFLKISRILDHMKIRKFYYYSPDKLKLIPISHFIPKLISLFVIFAFLISSILFFLAYHFLFETDSKILYSQEKIIRSEYEKEIDYLKQKYIKLASDFEALSNTTNDVRLAVNLTPIKTDEQKFGIGGTEFDDRMISYNSSIKSGIAQIYDYINNIEVKLNLEASIFEEIKTKFEENKNLYDCLPAIKPVVSPIGDRFGVRFHPILKRRRMHHGLDFLCNTGEEVVAPGEGVITYVGRRGGYGKVIRINHGFGYETIYGHLSKYKVKKGQKVKRGDIIALSGNSGSLSTGPHLHYEVRHNGATLNPKNFFFDETKLFEKSRKKF